MHKELEYYKLGAEIGFNQDYFTDYWMKLGGCAAVTAMDMSIYLDRINDEKKLYPFDRNNIVVEDYIKFSKIMKPYLRPRWTGIDKLKIYIEGMNSFLEDRDYDKVEILGISGHEDYEVARKSLKEQVDKGMLVPILTLKHKSPKYNFYEWHWYNLSGYEEREDGLYVKAITYGDYAWLNFEELWNTGFKKKGGLIIIKINE